MSRYLFGVLLGALGSVSAQVPLDQESIIAVGQCYAQCLDAHRERDIAAMENDDRTIDTVLGVRGTSVAYIRSADKEDIVTTLESLLYTETCQTNVRILREMDLCRASCQDMESAYASSLELSGEQIVNYDDMTSTKPRFEFFYNLLNDQLTTAGLWASYDQPVEGDSFAYACNAFLGLEQPEVATLIQSIENMPMAEE